MNTTQTARYILTLEEKDARAAFQSLESSQCARALQEIIRFLMDPGNSLLSSYLKHISRSQIGMIVRSLFKQIPYYQELELLDALTSLDGELAIEVDTILPGISCLYSLIREAQANVVSNLSTENLLNLRALFVYTNSDEVNLNEKRNFEVLMARHLSESKQNDIRRILHSFERFPSEIESTEAMSQFRDAIYSVEEVFAEPYGFTGGHWDPEVTTESFRTVIVPDGQLYKATIPDLPQIVAKGSTIRIALKAVGDKLAKYFRKQLQEDLPLPVPRAASRRTTIAIRGKECWTYDHPTIDHIESNAN